VSERSKVLIVDDDPDLVDRITQLLEDDYEVASTGDWTKLSKMVFGQRPVDLILMDVNLPTLTGDKLVGIINSTSKDERRPCIVYFSSSDEETMARLARETRADGYISKSARSVELLAKIEGYLQARGRVQP
jgi:response regulator RpfG family c-di-GMP phosphodiesterase